MNNPLLENTLLPNFEKITEMHIEPALEHCIETLKDTISTVENLEKPTWKTFIEPQDEAGAKLSAMWSPVSHLNGVKQTSKLRDIYDKSLPTLVMFYTELEHNKKLYNQYLALKASDEYKTYDDAQKRIIQNTLRDFKLAGVALTGEKKERYKAIQQELSQLGTQFSNNVIDATMGWEYHTENSEELSGLPEYTKTAAQDKATSKKLKGWLFSLDAPTYSAIMTYADDAKLRAKLYEAYATKASDTGPNAGKWDNSKIMENIVALRYEMANLVGFENYAAYSLATKMAKNSKEVFDFLNDLTQHSQKKAKAELKTLQDFAKKTAGVNQLNPWDIAYFSEKLKQSLFSFSNESLRPYFPLEKVMQGLFDITKSLYKVRFEADQSVSTWHSDVHYYWVYDQDNTKIAGFYLDLYARDHKRGGAWQDGCRSRTLKPNGELQLPIAYLVCNFTPPQKGYPTCLKHDEITTLFHEFGHGLHHMLTTIDHASIAGTSGVAWDAVELPSQFMENFCWQPETLAMISGHVETGEPIPEHQLEELLASREFQSGMMMVRQLEFALFDFHLNADYNPENPVPIQTVLDQVRQKVAVVIPPKFHRFQHSFSHIFAGGYGAGYYSYLWAEVLSSDVFSKFEQTGILNPKTGQEFLNSILSQGGIDDAMVLFIKFMGRKPKVDALLKQKGII